MASEWRRACVGCTRSKRQCTKGVPACRRCIDRGIPCLYPPARRTNGVVRAVAPAPAPVTLQPPSSTVDGSANPSLAATRGSNSGGSGTGSSSAEAEDICNLPFSPLQLTHADLCADLCQTPSAQPSFDHGSNTTNTTNTNTANANTTPGISSTDCTWFLAPESWVADYTLPEMEPEVTQDTILQRFVDGVHKWLREWATRGSSPLHHWHLYRERMPRHVQDAYTAVATYYAARTPATRSTVARVLDDRVAQLLQDQALGTSLPSGRHELDVFDHVSRVQALLAYQAIRLFDGDVRMRAQAEALIPTLFLWSKQLFEVAKEDLARRPARFLAAFAAEGQAHAGGFSRIARAAGSDDAAEDALWRAWVLVESVRRTWTVANYLQEIYLHMKRGWGECPGRVTLTMREGLWEAPSPYAWAKACRERGALFLATKQTESLVFDSGPEDVDEFSLVILELSYGVERIERWQGGGGGGARAGRERPTLMEVLG